MEAFVFAANLLYVATYFTEQLLRIRVMTLAAGCCLVVYHVCQPEPLLTIIGWNLFFIGLNLVQVLRLGSRRLRQSEEVRSQEA